MHSVGIPAHTPLSQVSGAVHSFPSSHDVPSAALQPMTGVAPASSAMVTLFPTWIADALTATAIDAPSPMDTLPCGALSMPTSALFAPIDSAGAELDASEPATETTSP